MPVYSNPSVPANEQCNKAHVILKNAIKSANSFLGQFESLKAARGSAGTTTDQEQDMLRAMLTFASAGIDSVVKQLIRDTLSEIASSGSNEGVHQSFVTFVERKLKREDDKGISLIAEVITHKTPRNYLLKEWVDDLTSYSMQSVEQLSTAAAAFDIPTHEITNDLRKLREVFSVRNQIVHEMDVNFGTAQRKRRPRQRDVMVVHTSLLLDVSKSFLAQVDKRLS